MDCLMCRWERFDSVNLGSHSGPELVPGFQLRIRPERAIAYLRSTGSHDGSSNICAWTWVRPLAKDLDKPLQTRGIQARILDLA
jgi:hypothetical protein